MTIAKPTKPVVIDALRDGYWALHRCLWVLLIPILLNSSIWLGTKLSFAPVLGLLRDTVTFLTSFIIHDPVFQEALIVQVQNADVRVPLALVNYVPLLPPSLLQRATPFGEHVWYVRSVMEALAMGGVINIVSVATSSIFLTLLTRVVQQDGASVRHTVYNIIVSAGRMIGATFIIHASMLLCALLLFIFASIMMVQGGTHVLSALLIAWYVVLLVTYFYTFFTIAAIYITHANPLRAIGMSVQFVHHNFFQTMSYLFWYLLIAGGFGELWRMFVYTDSHMLVAIVGGAYIGSGLAATQLVFYRDRVHHIVSSH